MAPALKYGFQCKLSQAIFATNASVGILSHCNEPSEKPVFQPTLYLARVEGFCALFWLGWRDSNPRMPGPKPGALPLGHTLMRPEDRTESMLIIRDLG